MIDVQDEILNGEPKYRITGDAGNILAENANIEMTTPVQQPGTPLNKALFDKITSRLALCSKYNNPTFKIEDSILKMHIDTPLEKYEDGQKVDLYIVPQFEEFNSNAFPTDFTSNSKDGFEVSTTSKTGTAYRAFTGAGCQWGYSGTPANCQTSMEVMIKCPDAIIPSTFYVKISMPADGNRSGTFTIYGSKDGSVWDTLIASQGISTNDDVSVREFTLSCDTQEDYKYFKIYIYSASADDYYNNLLFFNITSGKKSSFNANYPQTLQIGSLSEVPIEGTVELTMKTSLMYLNNKFIVKETEGVV